MKAKLTPSQEVLLRTFRIAPGGSHLRWSVTPGGGTYAGDVAGTKDPGGWSVKISGKKYPVSRVIWKMLYNEDPPHVDHKNRDPFCNDPGNLRAATFSQNMMNRRLFKNNTIGHTGVGVNRNGSYWAVVYVDNKEVRLGNYASKEEAIEARRRGVVDHHGQFGAVL